jgi:hypothetical protein
MYISTERRLRAGIELAPQPQSSAQIIQFGASSRVAGGRMAQLAVLGAVLRWNRQFTISAMLFR